MRCPMFNGAITFRFPDGLPAYHLRTQSGNTVSSDILKLLGVARFTSAIRIRHRSSVYCGARRAQLEVREWVSVLGPCVLERFAG